MLRSKTNELVHRNKAVRQSNWFNKNIDSGWHFSRFLYVYINPFRLNSFRANVDLYASMTAVCNWLLQGSSLKWDGNSTTQILKWKSCPKRRLKKWHTWYVLRLRSSIKSSRPVSDLQPWVTSISMEMIPSPSTRQQADSCLHSDSKCLLDGDKCLLGRDFGSTHNWQQRISAMWKL